MENIQEIIDELLESIDIEQTAKDLTEFYKNAIDAGVDIDGNPLPIPKAGNKPLIRTGLLRASFGWEIIEAEGDWHFTVVNIAPYASEVLDKANYFGVSEPFVQTLANSLFKK